MSSLKPTKKQTLARTHNWHIKQLRAFFHIIPPPVSPAVRNTIRQLIDEEIIRLGAESEILREEKRKHEYED
jgi:hypothetical protein